MADSIYETNSDEHLLIYEDKSSTACAVNVGSLREPMCLVRSGLAPVRKQNNHISVISLVRKMIQVVHRLAMKLDIENAHEYLIYMNYGYWQNQAHSELVDQITKLCDDEQYTDSQQFYITMIVQVVKILLCLEREANPISSELFQMHPTQPGFLSNMLIYYLDHGRYPYESINDRLYYDRPLHPDDKSEGKYRTISNVIDVMGVMLTMYLSPEEANYQYKYLMSGFGDRPRFCEIIPLMQHNDVDRLKWEMENFSDSV